MSLASVVDDELAKVRAMSVADIYSLPEHSTREIETTWKSRRSVSVYAEKCSDGQLRVIVKAFESRFPHASTQAHAGGFRVTREGHFDGLTEEDKATLY